MTRNDQVLSHLLSGRTITQGEAIVLGYGTRLASTVHRLRGKGHNIVTAMKEDLNGIEYAEYSLVKRDRYGNARRAA
jgi:Helix-turn-helix domain